MPDGNTSGVTHELPIDKTSTAPGAARRAVAAWLEGLSVSTPPATDLVAAAELVTSELVTNAVRYGREPMLVRFTRLIDGVRIEVQDAEPSSAPELQRYDTSATGGRGLQVVANSCRDWGWREVVGGKVVWADLAFA